jgi:ATP-dependent HslUV protease ATP-binding subunit HslU
VRKEMRESVYLQAVKEAEMRVIKAISGADAREQTIEMFRKKTKKW